MTTAGTIEVSVVVVVKNGAGTILRQLEALNGQVNAPPFEVIVVENGSRDRTVSIVQRWMDEAPMPIRLMDASSTPGIPFARNRGALAAKGRIVAYCDADDIVDPDWVAAIARALSDIDGAAAGFKRFVSPDGQPRPGAAPEGLHRAHPYHFAPACNLAITRSVLLEAGGFDESLPRYGFEDTDFCWRLQALGYPLLYAPEARITYYISDRTTAGRKVFLLARGRMLMARRHPFVDPAELSLASCLKDLAGRALLLPIRLLRPGSTPRQRFVREFIESGGRLSGYWSYWVRGREPAPRLLTDRTISGVGSTE